jgi:hypothetical protein
MEREPAEARFEHMQHCTVGEVAARSRRSITGAVRDKKNGN